MWMVSIRETYVTATTINKKRISKEMALRQVPRGRIKIHATHGKVKMGPKKNNQITSAFRN